MRRSAPVEGPMAEPVAMLVREPVDELSESTLAGVKTFKTVNNVSRETNDGDVAAYALVGIRLEPTLMSLLTWHAIADMAGWTVKPSGKLNLELISLNSRSIHFEEVNSDLRRAQPKEEGTRPRKSSTWRGMSSTKGELNLRRYDLYPRRVRPERKDLNLQRVRSTEVGPRHSENSTWKGEVDLGRKDLDPRRAQLEEVDLCTGKAPPEEVDTQPRRTRLGEGTSSSFSFSSSKGVSKIANGGCLKAYALLKVYALLEVDELVCLPLVSSPTSRASSMQKDL
ncbi:hypothetical protein FNV43_RR16634 [Rhamnella rubrinervis]|uniref:Uncharacterized protein n=1 Tax=Rhamnella rubrinervis TaxID=2594499 RepID=A0A8K0MDE8_9ROSA|nr:hypothetical protein FNV43_RR16634 [Rhamnella rubrinervis]